MNPITKFPLLCLLSVGLAACGRSGKNEFAVRGKLDACQLLTRQEIQEVQDSAVNDSKGSEQSNGRVRTSQCYYGTEQSNRSISLTLTQADPVGSQSNAAKAAWEETFGRYENEEREKESEAEREKKESFREQDRGEKEEEAAPPRKITGIGEEAFWSGSRVGGALYVLKKDVYIRISVGGPDPEDIRIKKSTALAQKALDHL